jgi:hypothetical protein
MKTWTKRLLWIGLGVAATVVVGWVGLEVAANQAEARMNEQAEVIFKRYPKTQSNELSQDLNRILVDIGVHPVGAYTRTSSAKSKPFPPIYSTISSYFEKQRRKSSGSFDPLPQDIQAYLQQQRIHLAKAQALLSKSDQPLWGSDLAVLSDPEFVWFDFTGIADLHQLVLLQAIIAEQTGQPVETERALEAAWKLRKSVFQSTGGKMWDTSISQTQFSIMRHFKKLSPQWQQRIVEVAEPSQMVDDAKLLVLLAYRRNATEIKKDSAEFVRIFEQSFLTDLPPLPSGYFRWANADFFGRLTRHYDSLASQNFCAERSEPSIPWWNVWNAGLTTIPQIRGEIALEAEYTRKVLEAKAIAAQQGNWPKSLPDPKSKACTGALWQYSVASDGTMTLTLVNPEPLVEARTEAISSMRPSSYAYSDRLR